MNYKDFLDNLDKELKQYFEFYREYIHCRIGCSSCCEEGDYPLSQIELEYLMQGFVKLDNISKKTVQDNIKNMRKGGACPFLIDKKCSVYSYRPIICRVHGLAYLCDKHTVKVPYCANKGKNFSTVYDNNEIVINPIMKNLDTQYILKDFEFGEIRNLFDWINK